MFDHSPRLFLIDCLRKQLLGPRQGTQETFPLENDPRDEYVTGILDISLQEFSRQEELEMAQDQLPDDSDGAEDEEWERAIGSSGWTPACDPRREPSSMGLSWIVRGPLGSYLEVACTLARYLRSEDQWQRHPIAWVHRFALQIGQQDFLLTPSQNKLRLICRERKQGVYQITLVLIHYGWEGTPSRHRSERLAYQPQLRVCLDPALTCVGLWEFEDGKDTQDSEESRLRLLYRHQPVLARGHFCAAVWRQIDPEQSSSVGPSPWRWEDGEMLDASARALFSQCDLRTEYLPAVAVQSPLADWRTDYGPEPNRSAQSLSQCYDPQQLSAALQPLINGYGRWIEALDAEVPKLESRYQAQALIHLEQCRESQRRMQEGLAVLVNDSQARLAFCFAQRALWLQAHWKGWELTWRPFQLGFWLQTLAGISDPQHPDREICDLLWFPTGGGKTEAYLAIIAYVLALRRLRHGGFDGTGVISRYTLRLLSIQQFRRALGLITACEFLRVEQPGGWRPEGCHRDDAWLWGQHRFCTGLWVGYSVTPSRLQTIPFPDLVVGALDLLKGRRGTGEPAQVLDCPCCNSTLALAEEAGGPGQFQLHFIVSNLKPTGQIPDLQDLKTHLVETVDLQVTHHEPPGVATLSFTLSGSREANAIEAWWAIISMEWLPALKLLSAHPTRPGYFLLTRGRANNAIDFEIYCPNPECALNLNQNWQECLPSGPRPADVRGIEGLAGRIPIPAMTVDEQLYFRPPSLLLATVDKFARLAYEPKAATLFGNFEYHHPYEGFYRRFCLRQRSPDRPPHPPYANRSVQLEPAPPPELILQDELHLIDGPLGSMVGLYETVIDRLCSRVSPPKYVASTATVREAQDQVRSLFQRDLRQFPAPGLSASDNFFALLPAADPHQATGTGRLYLGLCAPGRGAITPLVRSWACLLQAVVDFGGSDALRDPYSTPVGYFNSLNQLALVGGLWRQFIPQRIQALSSQPRELNEPLELSSRIESERLPLLLKALEISGPEAAHGVLATSMFGTGVDVSRLSLMVVHGQPKTTSSYIQATGRVGRQQPGLVITALTATRPRELNHYEYFPGYHLQLYRGVEPVTVFPYAPRARERGLGPMSVAYLRQSAEVDVNWRDRKEGARRMATSKGDAEVQALVDFFVRRSQAQPDLRRPDPQQIQDEVMQALQAWEKVASDFRETLQYEEYTLSKPASLPVVLGDPQHLSAGCEVAFRNAPQSLREVEPTTGFKV